MTRDYSKFLPPASTAGTQHRHLSAMARLGWQNFFSQQISVEDLAQTPPVRVTAVHRSGLHVLGEDIDTMIPPLPDITVGDWLLYDADNPAASRALDRKSLFERRAPGTERRKQLIAANVDTIFIVTSCNDDFNVARLERYLVLASEAEVTPVIVLTKADMCKDIATFVDRARAISPSVSVEVLNALSDEPIARLGPWCKAGQTVAFVGSSGVGKSTLVNALFRDAVADTAAVRQDDSKGRHTTTHRQLHFTPGGCAVLDTPGMRELQLTDVEAGIATVFSDLAELAQDCKFRDCSHSSEPGCAINAAVKEGRVDAVRLARWQKLAAEERFNSTTLAERKADGKSLRKLIRTMQKDNRK